MAARFLSTVVFAALTLLVGCNSEPCSETSEAVVSLGTQWNRISDSLIPTNSAIGSIAASDSVIIAVTNDQILRSLDGHHWESQSSEFSQFVVWNGERFFLFGHPAFGYSSLNGAEWQPHRNNDTCPSDFQSVGWYDTLFLATSGGQQIQSFLMSADGNDWGGCYASGHVFALATLSWKGRFYAAGDRIRSSIDGCSWKVVDSSADYSTRWLQAMAANDSTIVAAGNYGLILVSKDGAYWEVAPERADATIREVLWTGCLFVAVGGTWGARAMLWTSPDGYIWTKRLDATGGILLDIAQRGDLLVAVGEKGQIFISQIE